MLPLFYGLGYLEYGILGPPARDQTSIPYTGRWSLACWTARKVPKQSNKGQRIWNGKEEVRWLKWPLLKSQQWETIQSYRLNTASEQKQALSPPLASGHMGSWAIQCVCCDFKTLISFHLASFLPEALLCPCAQAHLNSKGHTELSAKQKSLDAHLKG